MQRPKVLPATHRYGLHALVLGLGLAAGTARADSTTTAPLRLSAFGQVSVATSTASTGDRITGTLLPSARGRVALDMFQIGIERPLDGDRVSTGGVLRLMIGEGVSGMRAPGLDLGAQEDLVEAWIVSRVIAGPRPLQLAFGRMPTLLGFEVIDPGLNPNASYGNQFHFVEPYTETGVELAYWPAAALELRARVTNGWDVVSDNNRSPSFMAKVGWQPDALTTLAALAYTGPEQPDDGAHRRHGGELLGTRTFGRTSVALQIDAGHEEGIDADWWAAGAWVALRANPALRFALRADVLDDPDGARTSGVLGFPVHDGQRLASLTLTSDLRLAKDLVLRPEFRYDDSDQAVFGGEASQAVFSLTAFARF